MSSYVVSLRSHNISPRTFKRITDMTRHDKTVRKQVSCDRDYDDDLVDDHDDSVAGGRRMCAGKQ